MNDSGAPMAGLGLPDGDPASGPPASMPTPPTAGLGSRALRNSLLILVVRVASRLITLVTVVVVGNALGAADFGGFQTAVTYGTLVSVVADLGYSSLLVREGARRPDAINRYLNNVLSAKVILFILAAPLLALALAFAHHSDLFVPAFAMLVVAGYSLVLRNALYAIQQLGFEIMEIVPESLVLLGVALLGVHLHQGPGFFMLAYTASYLFACIYFAAVLMVRGIARPGWDLDLGTLRPWLRAGLPLAFTYILTTLYFKVDVPILQRVRGDAEVGIYTFAYKPFEALLFLPVTVRTVVFPLISLYHRAAPHRVLDTSRHLFKALALLGWPCTVGLFLLAPQINDVLDTSHQFGRSATALRILALAIVFMFVDNTFATTLNAIDRQGLFARIAFSGLVVNIALNLVLIPRWGFLGASWAVVTTEVILVAIGWAVLRRQLGALPMWRLCWRILVAGAGMGGFVEVFHPLGRLHLFLVIVVAAAIYGVLLIAVGAVTPDERRLVLDAVRSPSRS